MVHHPFSLVVVIYNSSAPQRYACATAVDDATGGGGDDVTNLNTEFGYLFFIKKINLKTLLNKRFMMLTAAAIAAADPDSASKYTTQVVPSQTCVIMMYLSVTLGH